MDFSDSLHRTIDKDGNGRIEFAELLRALHPYATEGELETMMRWVSKEQKEPSLGDFELNSEQRREVASMFRLYDTDGNGAISATEFRQAVKRCGLTVAEADEIFAEADIDGSDSIDADEFAVLMRLTFFRREEGLTPSMLYGPLKR